MAPNLVKPNKRKYTPTSNSSSDDYNSATNAMTIEEFLLGKDEWRVGPDNFRPVTYPFGFTSPCSAKTRDAFKALEGNIEDVLAKYQILPTNIALRVLWPKDEPEESIDTLIINTDNQSQDKTHVSWIVLYRIPYLMTY